jgi:hypothetical protein
VSGTTRTLRRFQDCPYLGHLKTPRSREAIGSLHLPWACDNDAFSGFDVPRYLRMLSGVHGERPLFVTAPDVVGDAVETLRRFAVWGPMIREIGLPVAIVGHDGVENEAIPWDACDAFFIGGSTAWKLSRAAALLGQEAKRCGKWLHMGRVSSLIRLRHAYNIGCDSVDGTHWSRWGDKHIPVGIRWMERIHRFPPMWPQWQGNLWDADEA